LKLHQLTSRSAGTAAIAVCAIALGAHHASAQSVKTMHRAKATAQATAVQSPAPAARGVTTSQAVKEPSRIAPAKQPAAGARTRSGAAAVPAIAPSAAPKSNVVVMTPKTPVNEVAAILSTKAPGERIVHLSGFAGDVTAYDQPQSKPAEAKELAPESPPSSDVMAAKTPDAPAAADSSLHAASDAKVASPMELLPIGTAIVHARVKDVMVELRDAGAKVDAVSVDVPPSLEAVPSADAVLAKAVDSAVKEVYPDAKLPERSPTDYLSAGGTEGGIASHSEDGGASPASTATAELDAIIESTRVKAVAALESVPGGRRTADWSGTLSYRVQQWNSIFELARDSASLRQHLMALTTGARERAASADPALYRRPATLSQIHPSILDGRAADAGPNREAFALAMADCGQSAFVRHQGTELALAAVYLQDQVCLDKCIDILTACVERFPLQRPGWTAYAPNSVLPPEGDGVWLATSWGISGIVEMLTILGDRVPADLRGQLEVLLRKEVGLITRDWADQRPWYVRSRTTQSNQWIEPSAALVKATLYLGDSRLLPAYNLGVENLAASLATQGADGAFLEGVSYASQTLGALFDVLEDLKANSDMRCHALPFVGNCWKWFSHMLMPGRQYVNTYDSRMSHVPDWAVVTPLPSAISAALGSGDALALPTVRSLYPQGNSSIPGIRYEAALASLPQQESPAQLPTFASFASQQQLVWRSAWESPAATQRALGLFVRGGSALDGHCHRDQGQVSIYNGDRIVLMECGTPDYSTSDLELKYASALGHGIMQVGALPRAQAVNAPITVAQLDADGGRVLVDTTGAYSGVTSCTREVQWNAAGEVRIFDRVRLGATVPQGTELYRFHTGSSSAVQIVSENGEWIISWPGATLRMTASAPITVEQVQWPDAVKPPFVHQAILVRCTDPAASLDLTTTVTVDRGMASMSP
jgi:hypothetical protein